MSGTANRELVGEVLLTERLTRIDELTAKLEAARAVNHRLEQECEHLAAMLAAPPQLDAAMLAPN